MTTTINREKLEFDTSLVLSTSHVTKSDSFMLSSDAQEQAADRPAEVFVVNEYLEGFVVYVPSDSKDVDELIGRAMKKGYSDSLVSLLSLVIDLRDVGQPVTHIRLDRDGPVLEKLHHHDW